MSERRIVRHAMFTYTGADGVERHALRGEAVELTDTELERAERLEAVAPEDEAGAITAAAPVAYPMGPDAVLAAGAQADDAGSDEQVGETTETSGDTADTAAPAKPAARRARSSN